MTTTNEHETAARTGKVARIVGSLMAPGQSHARSAEDALRRLVGKSDEVWAAEVGESVSPETRRLVLGALVDLLDPPADDGSDPFEGL